MTLVSIGILNYYSANLLKRSVDSIIKNHPGFKDHEFIIVNNSLEEENLVKRYITQWKEQGLNICGIYNLENKYYAPAYNQAFKKASGKYFCFLNADTRFESNSISKMVNFLEDHTDYDMVGGRLIKPNGETQKTCSMLPDLSAEFFWNTFISKIFQKLGGIPGKYKEFKYYDWDRLSSREVESVCNAFCLIRSKVFAQVGGFGTNLFFWYTEYYLGTELKKQNKKTYFLAEAEVIHEESYSTRKLSRIQFYSLLIHDKYFFYRGKGYSRVGAGMIVLIFTIFEAYKIFGFSRV